MTAAERSSKYYYTHKAKAMAAARKWQLAHPEAKRSAYKKWLLANKDQARVATKAWELAHPEARIVSGAKSRCTNPRTQSFKNYGGRGIECRLTVQQLLAEIGPRPSPKYSIDRINNDGHYETGNIRWATRSQQIANRRDR